MTRREHATDPTPPVRAYLAIQVVLDEFSTQIPASAVDLLREAKRRIFGILSDRERLIATEADE